jgi:hypothetical protein
LPPNVILGNAISIPSKLIWREDWIENGFLMVWLKPYPIDF